MPRLKLKKKPSEKQIQMELEKYKPNTIFSVKTITGVYDKYDNDPNFKISKFQTPFISKKG